MERKPPSERKMELDRWSREELIAHLRTMGWSVWAKLPRRRLIEWILNHEYPSPEPKPIPRKATAPQHFTITLALTTACDEVLCSTDVRAWVIEQFAGCDLGDVEVKHVVDDEAARRQDLRTKKPA